MSKKYIHYGHKNFDREKFGNIRNYKGFTKPYGGFWASPVDAEFGWKEWCEREDFRECSLGCSFTFTLSPEAKVLYIDDVGKLNGLPEAEYEFALSEWRLLDFEKLLEQGYDAVEMNLSSDGRLYWALYGWDCDSILILNPDIVEVLE